MKGLYVGVPVIIGADGVEKIVEIDLNAAERQMFIKSVESVKGLVDACTKIAPQLWPGFEAAMAKAQPDHHAQGQRPIGPYSLAIESGDLVFISGQIPLDAATGKLVGGRHQCPGPAVAGEPQGDAGRRRPRLSRTWSRRTIFLTSMADFAAVNEVYKSYMSEPYPARSTIAVAALPMGAKVEIEMIASRSAA